MPTSLFVRNARERSEVTLAIRSTSDFDGTTDAGPSAGEDFAPRDL